MGDPRKLVAMLKEIDDMLVTCMRCGLCQAVCPVFAQSGRETDVARGKLALLSGLAEEMLGSPEQVGERLNRCLLCGTCEANCPSGVKVTDIFLRARAILTAYLGLSGTEKLVFRVMLANPGLFDTFTSIASKFQGLFIREADPVLGISCARFESDLVGNRHFKALAGKPLHALAPDIHSPAGTSGLRVAFFPGCVVDKAFPSVGLAALKALEHHGVGVFMPSGQACCGMPALSGGDVQTFERLVDKNLELFSGAEFDYLLTPCATCTSTLKKIWPNYARGGNSPETLARIAQKTMDISAFMVDVLKIAPGKSPEGGVKITYHDPCHLKNSLGVVSQPREILRASKGFSFVEMADAGTCCGCGGSFNLKHYAVSERIGELKAKNVLNSGADMVATSCPACMMQLIDALSKSGKGKKVVHVIEAYAQNLA